MKKLLNGEYVEMTKKEIAEIEQAQDEIENVEADKLSTLAEGLSTANSLAQVREAAKSILNGAVEQ